MKDFLGNELKVGDTVAFVHKEFGFRKITAAFMNKGVIVKIIGEKLVTVCTCESNTIKKVKGDQCIKIKED